jgi:hypothetical protein
LWGFCVPVEKSCGVFVPVEKSFGVFVPVEKSFEVFVPVEKSCGVLFSRLHQNCEVEASYPFVPGTDVQYINK